MRGWKKIFYANRNQKNPGKAIFISDQINFKIKTVRRNKEAYYIMMNPTRIHNNYIYIYIYIYIYAPSIGAPEYTGKV